MTQSGSDILEFLEQGDWDTHNHRNTGFYECELNQEYDREPAEVAYWGILKEKIVDLNDHVNEERADSVINSLRSTFDEWTSQYDLVTANEEFTRLLKQGWSSDDETREPVNLIDSTNQNNEWTAVKGFTAKGDEEVIPTLVCFLNGLPYVVCEIDPEKPIDNLVDYQKHVPNLFIPTLYNVALSDDSFKCGAVGAPSFNYHPWIYSDESQRWNKKNVRHPFETDLLIRILDWTFYEERPEGDVKIIPRYMQYGIVSDILCVEGEIKYTCAVWQAQGSGKSYSLAFVAKRFIQYLSEDVQSLVVVDTDHHKRRMERIFSGMEIRLKVVDTTGQLEEVLDERGDKVILVTADLFEDVNEEIPTRVDTKVLVDEIHNYFERGLINLQEVFPDANHIGFTGVPIQEDEIDGLDEYLEDYRYKYTFKDAVQDRVVLPFKMCGKQKSEDINRKMVNRRKDNERHSDLGPKEKDEVRRYIREVLTDVVEDYESKNKKQKAILVASTKETAALYGDELDKPNCHRNSSRRLRNPEDTEVILTADGNHDKFVQKYHTTPEERESVVDDFRKPDKGPKLLVVTDSLLDSIDTPLLKTVYLDKDLENRKLLQVATRTNRPVRWKSPGEVIDYTSTFENRNNIFGYDGGIYSDVFWTRDD